MLADARHVAMQKVVSGYHSICRLRFVISSSLSAASHKHLLIIFGSALNVYFELASKSRRRLFTIMAAV